MPSERKPDKAIKPRKGMPNSQLVEAEFKRRYNDQFLDPAFRAVQVELKKVGSIAWDAYNKSRKSPVTQKAGLSFFNSEYDLSVDWIAAHEAGNAAKPRHDDKNRRSVFC